MYLTFVGIYWMYVPEKFGHFLDVRCKQFRYCSLGWPSLQNAEAPKGIFCKIHIWVFFINCFCFLSLLGWYWGEFQADGDPAELMKWMVRQSLFVFFFSVSFMIENIFPIANKYSFVPEKVALEVEPAKLARPTTLECLFSENVIRQKLNRS